MRLWRTAHSSRVAEAARQEMLDGAVPSALGYLVDASLTSPTPAVGFRVPPVAGWRATRTWRWVRDICMGMVVVVIAPVAIIAFTPSRYPTLVTIGTAEQLDYAPLRELTLEHDPYVTPQAAGDAIVRVLLSADERRHRMRGKNDTMMDVLGIVPPGKSLFPSLTRSKSLGMPDNKRLISVAAGQLDSAESAWLARMASLPLWSDVGLVARARSVDIVGALFGAAPPPADSLLELPLIDRHRAAQVAYAGVARAAWHVSRGDLDPAESALRAVVSLGFVLLDNPVTEWEIYTGRDIIKTGLDGLAQLAALPKGSARHLAVAAKPLHPVIDVWAQDLPVDRERAAAVLLDPKTPRAIRVAAFSFDPLLVCGSLREVLLGRSESNRQRTAHLRQQLAQSDAERRLLEARESSAIRTLPADGGDNALGLLVVGTAKVSSVLLNNPRIASCTLRAVQRW